MTLYETTAEHDPDWPPGLPVTTQSMIKTFRSCPREAYYKYWLRLRPKTPSKPLTRGKWVHALLQAHYEGRDWREEHARWVSRFRKLFDEEKEALGDLPNEIPRLLEGYFWHYGDPQYSAYEWTVHEVEFTVEAQMPNGHLFRGRLDLLVEDEFGLWIVDHKTHKRLPDWNYRMLDEQSPLYIWACHQMGVPVRGFVWNYLCTAGIDAPRVLKDGTRFYKRDGDSDYPTYARAVRAAREEHEKFIKDPEDRAGVKAELARLKAQRWVPGAVPTSPHFRRDVIEKSDALVERVLAAAVRTSDRMHAYDFTQPDSVERNVGTCQKGFLCSYQSLSLGDLVTGDSTMTMKREYQKGDPLDYYDEKEERL